MDMFFNSKYNKILSLGANCYPKLFISKILKPSYGETELFDYIGTSMWSINLLLLNDFQGLYDKNNFELLQILKCGPYVVTNTKYYLRFKHDLNTVKMAESADFQEKMKRRIDRFKLNVSKNEHVLFIRQQESKKKRLPYNLHENRSEIDELHDFIDTLHMKYNCKKATVIFINLEHDGWNERHDILSIKVDSLDYDWKNAHNYIKQLFEAKKVTELLS
jgi:hypothetical protein